MPYLGKKIRALSLDLIKQRLDRGMYKRLDVFQQDIFAVLERARNLSRSDSQIFEDSIELQTHFINIRDEACGKGKILESKALSYTVDDLHKSVDTLKAKKQELEKIEEEQEEMKIKDKKETETEEEQNGSSINSATFNQQQYTVGDFVYTEGPAEPFLYLIENIYMSSKDGEQQMMYANRFFRPVETFHVSSRKFLENEVRLQHHLDAVIY